MKEIILRPISQPIDRTVRLPGSKSLSNRALLIAAVAQGASKISGLLLADDTHLMLDALRSLGIAIRTDEDRRQAVVQGRGGGWPNAEADIFCGNAGTVMRFLTAACCIGHGDYRLDGVARMRARPIGGLVDALRDLGAMVGYEENDGCCPLTIRARGLRGGTVRLDSPLSSQFVSALLMVAPRAARDVMIDIAGPLPSRPFVDMTLGVMDAFGVSVVEDRARKFIIPCGQMYRPIDYEVEPDATAASYFFAAAAMTGGRLTVEGLGLQSRQGDAAFVEVLKKMGCRVERTEQATTVWGPPGRLCGVDVDLNDMPDVAQTLAVLAAFAHGPTHIRNVANLRIKETDRLDALATQLGRLGVETEVREDSITIRPDTPPVAAAIDTYDDHRMAMSFALAGLRLHGVRIRHPDCVAKTFPAFFDLWSELGC
jgi:3-phosphoshikimate 1-carboxyvinyltransferase